MLLWPYSACASECKERYGSCQAAVNKTHHAADINNRYRKFSKWILKISRRFKEDDQYGREWD